jgi:hypothetical protein
MEKTEVLEILKRLGWEPAPPGCPHLAGKVFGEQEAYAWYQGKRLSFEFYSCGRNVAEGACCIPKSQEDVVKAVQYAEKRIRESFYMRFLAGRE